MNDNNSNNNEGVGVEVEAAPTFISRFFFGATEDNNSEDSIDQLPDTDVESDWGAPSSSNQQGKQPNTCSNIKFYLLLLATFAIFLGVGIGEYGIVYVCNHYHHHRGLILDTDYRDIRYA